MKTGNDVTASIIGYILGLIGVIAMTAVFGVAARTVMLSAGSDMPRAIALYLIASAGLLVGCKLAMRFGRIAGARLAG